MIQLEAILRDRGSLADGTRRIQLDCQEATPESLLEILKLNGKIGWFVFSETKIQEKDVPDVPVEFKGDKSPSQRLRSVLYKYWELNTGRKQTFEEFYRIQMEKIIEKIKDSLP